MARRQLIGQIVPCCVHTFSPQLTNGLLMREQLHSWDVVCMMCAACPLSLLRICHQDANIDHLNIDWLLFRTELGLERPILSRSRIASRGT